MEPDEDGLVTFMCGDKGFNEDRIRNGAKKLAKARNTTTQGRLDSFFKVLPNPNAGKRKVSSPTDWQRETTTCAMCKNLFATSICDSLNYLFCKGEPWIIKTYKLLIRTPIVLFTIKCAVMYVVIPLLFDSPSG